MIEYYAKLGDEAVYREERALWRVERHKLNIKRVQFLQRQDAELEEELQNHPIVDGVII